MSARVAVIVGAATALSLIALHAPWWVAFVVLIAYWSYLMVRVRRG